MDQSVGRTRDFFVHTIAPADRLRESRLADAQLAGERYHQRRCSGPPELLAPRAQLDFSEPEMALVGAGWNYVPVRWHS
jgi:hypothetical protein